MIPKNLFFFSFNLVVILQKEKKEKNLDKFVKKKKKRKKETEKKREIVDDYLTIKEKNACILITCCYMWYENHQITCSPIYVVVFFSLCGMKFFFIRIIQSFFFLFQECFLICFSYKFRPLTIMSVFDFHVFKNNLKIIESSSTFLFFFFRLFQ